MAVLFTADHHFRDGRRLGFDSRPFASAAEMDRVMVERWNAAVAPEDTVWHLGDFARAGPPEEIGALLGALNGTKHLIIGNNDGPATLSQPGFASVSAYAEMTVDGIDLVLCHYPFRTWNGMARGRLDLHGHSHGRLKPLRNQHDVGVDVWDFRPVRIGEIQRSRSRDPGRA